MGYAKVHFNLAKLYNLGQGVEIDGAKENYHLEEAVMGGHNSAYCILGLREKDRGNFERALKHHVINANLGSNVSVEELTQGFRDGWVKKDDLAIVLINLQWVQPKAHRGGR